MEPEFWLERWRNRQIGFHRESVNPLLQRYWACLGVPSGSRVFVPLCGKSRDLHWLAEQGYRVTGIEISPIAVEEFFAEAGLQARVKQGDLPCWRAGAIEILCGDFFDLLPREFPDVAAVYDRAALIAMPPGLRERYARHLLRLMPPGARMLLVTLEYPRDAMEGPPFPVPGTEVQALFGEQCAIQELAREDALGTNAKFRERGLDRLEEVVWRLERRSG